MMETVAGSSTPHGIATTTHVGSLHNGITRHDTSADPCRRLLVNVVRRRLAIGQDVEQCRDETIQIQGPFETMPLRRSAWVPNGGM